MEILEKYPTREAFEAVWEKDYQPLVYADVREAYETFVKEADKHIFLSDYEEGGCISQDDFMQNLSDDAMFQFQDILTEAFYDKNPQLYEDAFELYTIAQMEENPSLDVAIVFHEEYEKLYEEFVGEMFEHFFKE